MQHAATSAFVFVSLLAGWPAMSQISQIVGSYEVRLSGYCRSISERDTVLARGGDYRVRRGGIVTVTGVKQSILVDSGGEVDVRGTATTVFVAKGGRAVLDGERIQVFAEPGGDVFLLGKGTITRVGELAIYPHPNSPECN
jgi:hypothetical protein